MWLSTLAHWLGDDSADEAGTEAFLAARIENVMSFEKWKAGKDFDAPLRKAADVLSRMRYGAKS